MLRKSGLREVKERKFKKPRTITQIYLSRNLLDFNPYIRNSIGMEFIRILGN